MAVGAIAATAVTFHGNNDAEKVRKNMLNDAQKKQEEAKKEAEGLESKANETARQKAAIRAAAIKDSSTILTSATGVQGQAVTKKKTLGGV